jgi:primosomal protein N' (replication factor Y)
MYATVALTRPIHRRPPAGSEPARETTWRNQTYTYRLPKNLVETAAVGHLVQVPLRAGTALGVVTSVDAAAPPALADSAIRDVIDILDPLPVVTALQLDLASWIADTYLSPLSQKLRQSALLRRLPADDGEAILGRLADRGLVEVRQALIPPKAAPPRVQYVGLLADDRAIEVALPRLGRASKQADLLLLLAGRVDAPVAVDELCAQAGCSPAAVQGLVRRGWVEVTASRSLLIALLAADQDVVEGLLRAPKQTAALITLRAQVGPVDPTAFCAAHGISPAVLRALEDKGLARRIEEPSLILLSLPREQLLDKVIELRGGEKEGAVLEALRGSAGRVWVGGLYAQTGADLSTLHRLAERGLISLHAEASDRPQPLGSETVPTLSAEQESAWAKLLAGLKGLASGAEPYAALLHGVTGSGKTEIYLRAIEQVLSTGRRALVLVPEIGLTSQTVGRFEARFPRRVALLHGQLSQGQRYEVWDALRRGQVEILIGSRAALFAPLSRLGLIVVDEAHDASYKQDEPIPLPAYHACDVALQLGRLAGAAVLFGTATPDVAMAYRARQSALELLELPHRFRPVQSPPGRLPRGSKFAHSGSEGSAMPPVRIVDLRQELRAGNRSVFSRALQQALAQTLQAGEQAILYLNRRGSATFVLCRDCGYVARCPKCGIPLIVHRAQASRPEYPRRAVPPGLVCHRCNHRQPIPAECPQCGGSHIRHFGVGTERVEAELRELQPGARLLRWDRDTASGADHERYLRTFLDHRADILVGTQMIAKGLDLPLVTLVGVISADTALDLPDFRAGERAFQLLTQVGGRAGRSARGGQVIFQTYHPEHYAIRAAAQHDYDTFYRQELAYRRRLGYPPYARLLALHYLDSDPLRCRDEAMRLGRWLTQEIRRCEFPLEVIGPAPCFYGQLLGRYRWQIILRGADPAALLRDIVWPAGWRIDVDPVTLL